MHITERNQRQIAQIGQLVQLKGFQMDGQLKDIRIIYRSERARRHCDVTAALVLQTVEGLIQLWTSEYFQFSIFSLVEGHLVHRLSHQ